MDVCVCVSSKKVVAPDERKTIWLTPRTASLFVLSLTTFARPNIAGFLGTGRIRVGDIDFFFSPTRICAFSIYSRVGRQLRTRVYFVFILFLSKHRRTVGGRHPCTKCLWLTMLLRGFLSITDESRPVPVRAMEMALKCSQTKYARIESPRQPLTGG